MRGREDASIALYPESALDIARKGESKGHQACAAMLEEAMNKVGGGVLSEEQDRSNALTLS